MLLSRKVITLKTICLKTMTNNKNNLNILLWWPTMQQNLLPVLFTCGLETRFFTEREPSQTLKPRLFATRMPSDFCLIWYQAYTLHQKLHQYKHTGILDNSRYDFICVVLLLRNARKCLIIPNNSGFLSESRQWNRKISNLF